MTKFVRLIRWRLVLVTLGLTTSATACVPTQFWGSAPSPVPGYVYVAGKLDGRATLWLCPTTAVRGECRPVNVEVL
jgi:hypothetical protein